MSEVDLEKYPESSYCTLQRIQGIEQISIVLKNVFPDDIYRNVGTQQLILRCYRVWKDLRNWKLGILK